MNVCSGRRRRGLCIIYLSLQFLNNRCPTNLCTAGCRGSGEGERSGACFSECRGSQCFAVDFLAHWPFSVLLQSSPQPAVGWSVSHASPGCGWSRLAGAALVAALARKCPQLLLPRGPGWPWRPGRAIPAACAVLLCRGAQIAWVGGHGLQHLQSKRIAECWRAKRPGVQEREFSFIKSARLLMGVTHGPAHLATRLCLTQTRDDTLLHPTGCKQPTEIAEVSLLL